MTSCSTHSCPWKVHARARAHTHTHTHTHGQKYMHMRTHTHTNTHVSAFQINNVGGQPSLFRCNDARFGLNITYHTFLSMEQRPLPETVVNPTSDELQRPYIAPDVDEEREGESPVEGRALTETSTTDNVRVR